jgi:cysteine desulfurase
MLNEVLDEMLPYMKEYYGNPSSIHRLGRQASNALQLARKRISRLINAKGEIVFTSGATEANNLALKGFANAMKINGNHIITSSIEHEAILEPCKELKRSGFDVTYLPVDKYGMIDIDALESEINEKTILISVMFANNEVGTIQPVKEIAEIAHKHNIVFHTDAVQAAGKIPVDVRLGIDMITLSAHKMYGPKGVGALCINNDLNIEPILHGGGQENQIRSGTQNVAAIVGMGKAAELAMNHMDKYANHVQKLRSNLIDSILNKIKYSKLNGHPTKRLPNNAHFTFFGVNGEDLIMKLDESGIEASTGSACSVQKQKASHVLQAMGFNHEEITGSLRLTLGIQNTSDEMEKTVDVLVEIVRELRKVSPYGLKYTV